ncbi:MAG: cytochrome c oxidase subunit II [Nakamurella sp.]
MTVSGSRLRRFTLAGGLAGASVLLSGCSLADLPRFGWPEGHTDEGARMQYFWSAMFCAALVIGVLVWGLMFWSFAMHRKKKGSPLYPKQTKENLPLEIVYTAIPMVLVMVIFYFTVTTENQVLKMSANPDVTVNVTAFKWNWDFSYQGSTSPDAPAGATGKDAEVHTVGSSSEIPMLVLPTNKIIQYQLESKDVIHSFWVPDFLFKRDVFPYPEANQVDNGDKFQNTITVEGPMVGRCAELCGQYHSMMNFEVRAMPDNLFNQYLELRQTVNPATGRGYTNFDALTAMNCGELCAPTATTTPTFDTRRTADNILAGGN